MKSIHFFQRSSALLVLLFAISCSIYSQLYSDSLNVMTQQNQQIQHPNEQNSLSVDNYHYYKWETPVLDKVDLKGIEAYQNNHETYLANLESLENVQKKNRQLLSSFYKQAKDLNKALNNEKKNLKEKKKFYKQDEKLLNREKTLRNREAKLLQKERKTLKRQSKDFSFYEVEDKTRRLDDREYRIGLAEEKWKNKRESNQQNLENIVGDEKALNARTIEIKERIRSLDYFKRDIDLKTKQLRLEQRQVKQEIKKAKAAARLQKR